MQPEVIVGLMSAGVGALAIAAGTFTTYRSLEVQRDNTKRTLETQRALADNWRAFRVAEILLAHRTGNGGFPRSVLI
jgi:hypothetical protein